MSDIRYDRLHDCYVIIATERLHRPDIGRGKPKKEAVPKVCPFCEGHESMTPPEIFALREPGSLPNTPHWRTRVVPNLYKAVQIEAPYAHHFGLFEHWDGFGAHEIIIDTPRHLTSMVQWSSAETSDWLRTLRERVADLRKDSRIAYISLFKNEGTEAGATQSHSHTQLIGLPIIPARERTRYRVAHDYFVSHARPLLQEVLAHEREDARRIVAAENGVTAYCPYASAYPFEVLIAADRVPEQIDTLSETTIAAIVPTLQKVLSSLQRQLGFLEFNLILATPPLQAQEIAGEILEHAAESCPFYLRIVPRLYRQGGFEISTGIMINPVAPETAAKLLKEGIDA